MAKNADESQKTFYLVYYHVLLFVVEILVILLVLYGIMECCKASYRFCYDIFGPVSYEEKPGEDREFQVEADDTLYNVAGRLEEKKLIGSKYSFYARITLMSETKPEFCPGSYVLNTSMDYDEIINALTTSN